MADHRPGGALDRPRLGLEPGPVHWAIRLRRRLLIPGSYRWNAWVRDVTARLERQPHAVVWGGRPIDYQVGSARDLAVTRRRDQMARAVRSMRAFNESMRQISVALTVSTQQFNESMRRLQSAFAPLQRRRP